MVGAVTKGNRAPTIRFYVHMNLGLIYYDLMKAGYYMKDLKIRYSLIPRIFV